jgi:hypothetical protein
LVSGGKRGFFSSNILQNSYSLLQLQHSRFGSGFRNSDTQTCKINPKVDYASLSHQKKQSDNEKGYCQEDKEMESKVAQDHID